jgi:integrase
MLLEEFKNSFSRFSKENTQGLMPKSINAIISCVTIPLGEAKRLGIILENPSTDMRKLVGGGNIRKLLSLEEAKKVFEVEWEDFRSMLASQVAASHGLRAGEVAALQIQDLNFTENTINVQHGMIRKTRSLKDTKTHDPRIIYTDIILLEKLKQLHSMNPHGNDYIFWDFEEPKNQ